MSIVSGFMMGAAIGNNIRQMFTGEAPMPAKPAVQTAPLALVAAVPGRRRYRAAVLAPELAALLEEAARIGTEGFDEGLFERTRRAGIGSALRGMEDFDDVCVSLALDEFDGFCYLDYPALMASIAKEECEAFIRDTLQPERLALSIVKAKQA